MVMPCIATYSAEALPLQLVQHDPLCLQGCVENVSDVKRSNLKLVMTSLHCPGKRLAHVATRLYYFNRTRSASSLSGHFAPMYNTLHVSTLLSLIQWKLFLTILFGSHSSDNCLNSPVAYIFERVLDLPAAIAVYLDGLKH